MKKVTTDTDTQLQIDVGIIKSEISNIKKILEKIVYVPQGDFDEFRKEVRETMVTQAEFKPIKTLIYTLITAVLLGLLGASFNVLSALKVIK